ncbi:hypothetical protein EON63_07930, partial [archaeon]
MDVDVAEGSSGAAIDGDGFFAAPVDISYNVPSGYEYDPEILRAENLFYNTPMTEKYAESVYGAIKNIQAECAYDFEKFCGNNYYEKDVNFLPANLFPSPDGMLQQIFSLPEGRRRLLATNPSAEHANTGRDTLAYLRTLYL